MIYNPGYWRRDGHQPFEVYQLVNGEYQLQIGEPYWMVEVGLGIGRHQGIVGGAPQELLGWYNQQGTRYLTAEERYLTAEERSEQLAQYLRAIGVDPDNLPNS